MLSIIVNYKQKTLSLVDTAQASDEVVGPYLAMYLYRYMDFSWDDWNYEDSVSLNFIQSITKDLDWEPYLFSIIVKEGMSNKDLDKVIVNLGYNIDYVLERATGSITVLHQTDHIKELVKYGYTLTDAKDGEGNYSFGRGVYCLDKNNFTGDESGWKDSDNVFTGKYEGEYLRCIEDIESDSKSGKIKKFQQEILIPFTERSIIWETKE